jgi:hypothetical protein
MAHLGHLTQQVLRGGHDRVSRYGCHFGYQPKISEDGWDFEQKKGVRMSFAEQATAQFSTTAPAAPQKSS